MTVLLVLVGVAFTTFMLYLTLKPLVARRDDAVRVEQFGEELQEIELLMARRNVLVSSLRELEFEKETSKIAADDFERFRGRYEREAVTIMRRLDDIHGGHGWQARVDAELEAALGRKPRYAGKDEDESTDEEPKPAAAEDPTTNEKPSEDSVEAPPIDEQPADAVAAEQAGPDEADASPQNGEPDRDEDTASPTLAACANCGTDLEVDDRFCSQCGTPVHTPDTANTPAEEANA